VVLGGVFYGRKRVVEVDPQRVGLPASHLRFEMEIGVVSGGRGDAARQPECRAGGVEPRTGVVACAGG
jgi:hypothetical protein